MSALIHHFVVHRIAVDDNDKLVAVPRDKCLNVTPEIEVLAQQINHSFNVKPGKGVGHFCADSGAEDNDATFESDLAEFLSHKEAGNDVLDERFHAFSLTATQKLIKALIDTGTVETGFLIFCQYEFLATQYLMITLLNTRSHVEVNQALELNAREHLDLARMQLAVRIDLTAWKTQPEQERYISFIKGRMGRKVSDFFSQFIGCEERVDVKQQNKQLISTVDAYLSGESLDPQEQHQQRDGVTSYFKEKIDAGESLSIEELSSRLPANTESGRDFSSFTDSLEVPLEKEIQPDPAALKQLAKFSGQGGGVSLSFDRKLLGDRVFYDPATDTLTLRGLPPNLKDQLTRQSSMD